MKKQYVVTFVGGLWTYGPFASIGEANGWLKTKLLAELEEVPEGWRTARDLVAAYEQENGGRITVHVTELWFVDGEGGR